MQLNLTPTTLLHGVVAPDQSCVIYTFSQLLAFLRNSGRSLQNICQILSSSSIPSLQYTLCLAGILLTPYDARLVTAPCKHLQFCIIDALSCARPAIHSDTNLHTFPCHRQSLLMRTGLICGRHQLSHLIHHISFSLSQKVDTTLNPVIGEGVNAPVLLWPNGDAQFMDRNPELAWPHAIHSWCRPVSLGADIILTDDCYANNVSVTSFCRQNYRKASSFCRMIGMYEDHRVRLLVSTEGKFI